MISIKLQKNVAYGIIIAIMAVITVLIINPLGLSITETSCTGDKIWIKYSLADDDAKLASFIPDCKNNPAGGWVGSVDFTVDSYAGDAKKTYYMGGYTATKDSVQKISCGTNQGGKEFAGTTIPNDGIGSYFVNVKGTYYSASENYSTPHKFEYDQGTHIACILPSSKCEDGTPINTCSAQYVGKYCTASAYLANKASKCGCPEGMSPVGEFCKVPPPPDPDDDPIVDNPVDDEVEQGGTGATGDGTSGGSTAPQYSIFGIDVKYVILGLSVVAIIIAGAVIWRRR